MNGVERAAVDAKKPKKSGYHWLLWWKIDPEELTRQITEYNTLKVYQSARGISLLCTGLSAIITIGFTFFGWLDALTLIDGTVLLVLGAFIYFGRKWANGFCNDLLDVRKSRSALRHHQSRLHDGQKHDKYHLTRDLVDDIHARILPSVSG